MSLLKIAWRSIQQRGLASILTASSMALGVMLVVSVLLTMGVVTESFRSNSSLGYNMIIGAKGGRLQLVLNTVYYLSTPIETVPYHYYQEFLPAEQRSDNQQGKFADFTLFAIPVCLGDFYHEFRVVGTTPQMFDDFEYDVAKNRKYEFSHGRNFVTHSPEHGYFESVLGAAVARKYDIKVGDKIYPTHGAADGAAHDEFFVVGILKPTGTPNDRAVFINVEGFYLLEGHAKDASLAEEELGPPPPQTDPSVSLLSEERRNLRPLPESQREITAILVRTVSPLVTPGLRNTVEEGPYAQAVLPILEIHSLFRTIVGPIKFVMLLFTMMICVVSGLSILVSIYNSMSERKQEIAVMRALGAGRATVMSVVLLESILLSLGGGLIGWVAGHLLIGGVASPYVEERTGVTIGVLDWSPVVKLGNWLGESPISDWGVSGELLLIPGLILLAIVVGFLPAISAYRTDVAKALAANP